jgi:hypothetical protein
MLERYHEKMVDGTPQNLYSEKSGGCYVEIFKMFFAWRAWTTFSDLQMYVCLGSIGVRQGVAMDSLNLHPGPPCPTLLCPAGGPPLKRLYAQFSNRLLSLWTPHIVRLWWECSPLFFQLRLSLLFFSCLEHVTQPPRPISSSDLSHGTQPVTAAFFWGSFYLCSFEGQ